METLHDKKQHHSIKKNIKVDKKTNYTTDRPTPIKVYFPNISINKVSDIINTDKKIGNKTNKSNTIDISKYLEMKVVKF